MPYKVLVADDDWDNRTIASEVLGAAGFSVHLAVDGEEALLKVTEEKPDLVFLDMSMPKLDGWEITRRLKAGPETRSIIVIAFTAHAMVGDEAKARAAGCDDYLSKPCPPAEIRRKAQHWLGLRNESLKKGGEAGENFGDR